MCLMTANFLRFRLLGITVFPWTTPSGFVFTLVRRLAEAFVIMTLSLEE